MSGERLSFEHNPLQCHMVDLDQNTAPSKGFLHFPSFWFKIDHVALRRIMLEAQTFPGHKKCRLPTLYIPKDNYLSDFENFEFSPSYGLSIVTQSLVVFAHCFPSVAGARISNGN